MVPGFRCWQSPWRGLFHNLGHSQGLLVDLAQIPLADGVACSQSVDCSSGGLTTEISGSETPRFLQDVWPDHGKSRGFPSSLHLKEVTQARLCSPHFLQDNWRGLGGRADPPTRHACAGKCRRMLTGWISHVGWARYSHVKGLGQGWWVHTHNPAELCGYREWSEEDCSLEQIQLKIWASVSFQQLLLCFSIDTFLVLPNILLFLLFFSCF